MAFSSLQALHGASEYHNTWVGWSPPPLGWHALNTDGCIKQQGRMASGGVIRDHLGH